MTGASAARRARTRKALALSTVLAAHVAILLVLLGSRTAVQVSGRGALTVVALADPSSLVPPAAAQPPARPKRPLRSLGETPAAPSPPAPAAPSAPGEACAPLDAIGADLAADRASLAAIEVLPLRDPPATEPVILWSAGWTPLATTPPAPLAEVRTRIETVLATQTPECLTQPIIGPRFLAVPTLRGPNLLVFGSGVWRWQELVPELPKPEASAPPVDAGSFFSGIFDEL
jgi:hypothetical protein